MAPEGLDDAPLDPEVEQTLWDVTSDDEDLSEATGRFFRDRAHEALGATPFTASRPCSYCGSTDALLRKEGNQNVVRCRECKRFVYNAPKHETGEAPRTVATVRQGIKPNQQVRILERDGGACVLCHSTANLTIGHALSIKDATEMGEVGPYLNSDENLLTMCEACNLGLGGRSVLPRAYHLIVLRLHQAHSRRQDPRGVRNSLTNPRLP